MKIGNLWLLLLLFLTNQILASCNNYTLQMDLDRCWLGKANDIEKEMNNKYAWILYYNINALYILGSTPTQAAVQDYNKFAIPLNEHIKKAHELFLQYRQETCTGVYNSYSGGTARRQFKYICNYTLTKSYIADLEDQFFPQGWQSFYQDYLKNAYHLK